MHAKPKQTTHAQISLGGRTVEYRVVRSRTAHHLRVRVGPRGIEVVRPLAREPQEVTAFLQANRAWITDQMARVQRLRSVRRAGRGRAGEILFRGEPTQVQIAFDALRRGANRVGFENGQIAAQCGPAGAPPAASLANWLRREAKRAIQAHLDVVTARLKRRPQKVYVMSQRTKWGNCSARHNVSFNCRLILAPDFVFRYLVTHEAAHLAVPDHSQRFWLTLQSLAPQMERAKQWLAANSERLFVDLDDICRAPRFSPHPRIISAP